MSSSETFACDTSEREEWKHGKQLGNWRSSMEEKCFEDESASDKNEWDWVQRVEIEDDEAEILDLDFLRGRKLRRAPPRQHSPTPFLPSLKVLGVVINGNDCVLREGASMPYKEKGFGDLSVGDIQDLHT